MKRKEADSFLVASPHPANNQLFKALCQLVKIVLKLIHFTRGAHQWGCRSSTWDLSRPRYDFPLLPQKLLIKTEKTLQFSLHFKVPIASLCLTRDRMTASSLSLSLITYRLRVTSDLISSEFYPVFPLMASKGEWFRGALWWAWWKEGKLGLVLITLLMNNV